jgi:preprotein translocase subunit SecG
MSQPARNPTVRTVLGVIFALAAMVLGVVVLLSSAGGKDVKYYIGGGLVAASLAIFALLL